MPSKQQLPLRFPSTHGSSSSLSTTTTLSPGVSTNAPIVSDSRIPSTSTPSSAIKGSLFPAKKVASNARHVSSPGEVELSPRMKAKLRMSKSSSRLSKDAAADAARILPLAYSPKERKEVKAAAETLLLLGLPPKGSPGYFEGWVRAASSQMLEDNNCELCQWRSTVNKGLAAHLTETHIMHLHSGFRSPLPSADCQPHRIGTDLLRWEWDLVYLFFLLPEMRLKPWLLPTINKFLDTYGSWAPNLPPTYDLSFDQRDEQWEPLVTFARIWGAKQVPSYSSYFHF